MREEVQAPSSLAGLDLCQVRYFTVVAAHRHFGRADTELLAAQPSSRVS